MREKGELMKGMKEEDDEEESCRAEAFFPGFFCFWFGVSPIGTIIGSNSSLTS